MNVMLLPPLGLAKHLSNLLSLFALTGGDRKPGERDGDRQRGSGRGLQAGVRTPLGDLQGVMRGICDMRTTASS